jgi:hypothetical protein
VTGRLEYWSEPKGFGIVVVRQEEQNGYRLIRFYLAKHRINFIGVSEIKADQYVQFRPGPIPPGVAGGHGKPVAFDAEIFESQTLARLVDEKSATPVAQESSHE